MIKNSGLVLEGGAARGVFTAGVLDCLMAKDIYFPYVVGVSAGSCNAMDYVSQQVDRTRKCMIVEDKSNRYLSFGNILRGKDIYDMDMVFDRYPKEIFPFDFDTYFASETRCEMVVTNCRTGKAEYLSEKAVPQRLLDICRASSSMPIVSRMVRVDGKPYLDGGLADSIPIKHALEQGMEKVVLILTRNPGYRKKDDHKMDRLYNRRYAKAPRLLQTIKNRTQMYNETLDYIEKLEAEGKIFVIRPEMKCVSRIERNTDKLTAFYHHGQEIMERELEVMMAYLEA